MAEKGDPSKAAKKAAKAKAKIDKKLAKAHAQAATTGSGGGVQRDEARPRSAGDARGLSPAERSAAAAERQVALQRFRVIFAAAVAVVTILTFLITVKPWRLWGSSPESPPPATEPSQ